MSTNGIVMISEAVHRIVMVLKSDVFTKEEMGKLKKIIETLQRITEKTLGAGPGEKEQFTTLKMVEAKGIKCGDALHCRPSPITGAWTCYFADETHGVNAVAAEDLAGSEVLLNQKTGQVCNAKGGDDA